jgi:hypothetical protein
VLGLSLSPSGFWPFLPSSAAEGRGQKGLILSNLEILTYLSPNPQEI